MKPDFIVIGAMKCGTSTVKAYFEDHPDVFMVAGGEPNFFSHDENWTKGVNWYERLFDEAGTAQLRAEGSNDYSNLARYPDAPERLSQLYPDVKIVYMVRDPIARVRSDWVQRRVDSGDHVPATLERAISEQPEIFVDQSLYWRTLQAYRQFFPSERIFVAFLEDLNRDRDTFFARLTDFLGVRPSTARRGHLNPSKGKRVPSPLYTRVRQTNAFTLARKVLPKPLRTTVKEKLLSRPIAQFEPMTEAAHTMLVDMLASDATALLDACGKPRDFWRFDPPTAAAPSLK
jgi:hypothetical protein